MAEIKISLLKPLYESDEVGNQLLSYDERFIYAEISSASSSEFWRAGQTGLKADYRAVIWKFEYGGESKVRYKDTIYEVYRTYMTGDKIELYLRTAIGTQGGV